MKSIAAFSILVLAFCIGSFAQTNELAPCPTVSLTNEPSLPTPKGYISYTVAVNKNSGKYNLEYEWTIKGGEIVSGQGTSTVKIKLSSDSLTVTANVKVLPQDCSRSVTESFVIDHSPSIILIDEFSTSVSRIDKARLDALVTELENNPSATVYILEKFQLKTSRKAVKLKIQKLEDYLFKSRKVEKVRIIVLTANSDKNSTQFFIVPVGAIPPTCDSCVRAKLK